ncbi:MAG TPA: mechanosensitive ion channel domain-containing protein [Steroidobacteraceae bacterium]|nr:mechanosensitive ion channel domain-containing protein [Steroidobacteraceae bacterium]
MLALATLASSTSPASAAAAPDAAAPDAAAPDAAAPAHSSATSTSAASSVSSAAASAPPLGPAAVIAHVRQSVDWYHQIQSIEALPELSEDVVAQDQLQDSALSAVRLAFSFGEAAARLLAAGEHAGAAGQSASALQQASDRMAARISALQMQLDRLNGQLAHASARQARTLRAQRSEVDAALELAREVQGTIGQLASFQSASLALAGRSSNSLLGQIQDLKRSVPEASTAPVDTGAGRATGASTAAAGGASPRTATAKTVTPAAPFRPQSAGVFALVGDVFALESAKGQIDSGLKATQTLIKQLESLRQPLLGDARTLVNTSLADAGASDVAQLSAARQALRQAADRFKQLSSLLVPLGEQNLVLVDASGELAQWRTAVQSRLSSVARYLAVRAIVLGTSIAAVLVLSEIWRRATFRYLHDVRRRRQFLALRRIAVAILLVLVIAFGLVSELGSLATYVGFITAGLAVALQNVILAIVAYFFLIGRYGVKVGDRITLAGVTGRVVEIGLVRIYLMELTGADLHPAGRIVVLSNAVLFQPQALYKEVPGAAYQWHTIRLTLEASVDVQAARKRLLDAAERVYETYKQALEERHALVQRLVEYEAALPGPEVQVGYAESGLRFDVRYPLGREEAATVDLKMLQAIRESVAQAPALPVAASGEPAIHSET